MRASQAGREEGEPGAPQARSRQQPPGSACAPPCLPLICTRARTQATPRHLESVVASPPVCSWRPVGAGSPPSGRTLLVTQPPEAPSVYKLAECPWVLSAPHGLASVFAVLLLGKS